MLLRTLSLPKEVVTHCTHWERAAVVLRFFEQMSLKHVAQRLGISEDGAQKPEILLLNKVDTEEGDTAYPFWRTLHPEAIPISARTAPFELEPRTFTNPNFCMMRPVYSPSKLSLLMTRTSRSRHQYMAAIMQLCQKEYT